MKSPFIHIMLIAIGVGCIAVSMYDVKYVEGSSMAPTLRHDDAVIIYRWAYGLQLPLVHHYLFRWGKVSPGELVYLRDPVCMVPVVKRCAGAEDTLIIKRGGSIRVGEVQLMEKEIFESCIMDLYAIPEGKLFLLGDNRGISFDSRHYGLVDEKRIEGRVVRFW